MDGLIFLKGFHLFKAAFLEWNIISYGEFLK